MNIDHLRTAIIRLAKEEGKSELDLITAMQGVLARRGDEANLELLCKLKREFIKI